MRNIFNFHILLYKSVVKVGKIPVHHVTGKVFGSLLRHEALRVLSNSNSNFIWPVRYIHTTYNKSVKQLDYSQSEKKRDENAVVYYGNLTGRIKGVRVFTCMTSLGGLALQPLILQNILSGDFLPKNLALWTCIAFFTFVTPFLFHIIAKKYVTEIRYNSATDTYTATTLSFFLQRRDISFKIDDISAPDLLPLFTTIYIKNKPVFIAQESFLEDEHYIKMMGYDKPMDLKLSTNEMDKVNKNEG